jgi:hypothetical protein
VDIEVGPAAQQRTAIDNDAAPTPLSPYDLTPTHATTKKNLAKVEALIKRDGAVIGANQLYRA